MQLGVDHDTKRLGLLGYDALFFTTAPHERSTAGIDRRTKVPLHQRRHRRRLGARRGAAPITAS
jgi:hypothetical protein